MFRNLGFAWVRRAARVLLPVLFCLSCARGPAVLVPSSLEDALRRQLDTWLAQKSWSRADGYSYAVDLGQLLIYAARARDRPLYLRLREVLLRDYLIEQPCDVTTRGMVAWRWREGEQPEASGTTEALRVAQGLWEGSRAFSEPQDLRRALRLLRGYLAHQCGQGDTWLVRNYFNLGTRTFVTNSYLIDYDPDLLQEVGETLGERSFLAAAQRSYDLVRRAATPAGLLYEVVQPEIATLMDSRLSIFSPNDEVRLIDAVFVAERSTHEAPELGRRLLRFAISQPGTLRAYYLGRSGEGLRGNADVTVYAALLRLALRLGERGAAEQLREKSLLQARAFLADPKEPRLFVASELLLSLQAARTDLPPLPPPPALTSADSPELATAPTIDEDGLSPTGRSLYRLFLELQPPQAQDGQRCSDPAVADMAEILAESLAPQIGVAGWAANPAQRQTVKQKVERFLRALKVERTRLQPIMERILDHLIRLPSTATSGSTSPANALAPTPSPTASPR